MKTIPLSRIEISKSALKSNILEFRKNIKNVSKVVGVVKANAYGHGLLEVVSASEKYVDAFQVDDIEELRTVRAITKKDVFVFGYVSLSNLKELVSLQGILGCYNIETIKALERIGKELKQKIKIHLKVDAFLGRQGIFLEDLDMVLSFIKKSNFITIDSVYSHFSDIEDSKSLFHAEKQFEYLMLVKQKIMDEGFKTVTHHISATSGFLSDMQGNWGGAYVRLGIGMYGLWPSKKLEERFKKKINLKPVMRWVSGVAQIKKVPKNFPIGYGLSFITKKPTTIALIPQGYSDGYDRKLSNNGIVLIGGKECDVLGRVAMNMFVVDVSNIKNIKIEDEVVILGKQNNKEIKAEFLADKINTINYEVVARINPLLPRILKV